MWVQQLNQLGIVVCIACLRLDRCIALPPVRTSREHHSQEEAEPQHYCRSARPRPAETDEGPDARPEARREGPHREGRPGAAPISLITPHRNAACHPRPPLPSGDGILNSPKPRGLCERLPLRRNADAATSHDMIGAIASMQQLCSASVDAARFLIRFCGHVLNHGTWWLD